MKSLTVIVTFYGQKQQERSVNSKWNWQICMSVTQLSTFLCKSYATY